MVSFVIPNKVSFQTRISGGGLDISLPTCYHSRKFLIKSRSSKKKEVDLEKAVFFRGRGAGVRVRGDVRLRDAAELHQFHLA